MLPVLWVKLACSKGQSQVGNWYFYFKQLIACKFLITQFLADCELKLKAPMH